MPESDRIQISKILSQNMLFFNAYMIDLFPFNEKNQKVRFKIF